MNLSKPLIVMIYLSDTYPTNKMLTGNFVLLGMTAQRLPNTQGQYTLILWKKYINLQNDVRKILIMLLCKFLVLTCWHGNWNAELCTYRCSLRWAVATQGLVFWRRIWKSWAATWQNQQNECAPSEDSGQPGHSPSLIRVFAVRSMGS